MKNDNTYTPEPLSAVEKATSMKNRIAYGPGGFSENLAANSIGQLVNPIFAIALGVNPAMVGVAMAIPRFVDAFTDPLMGSISDNWQGRWGRRRPFIFLGAILSGLCVAGLWWTPEGASTDFHTAWLVVFLLLATIGPTMFGVPYVALGMEAPKGRHERTIWMAWRSMFHKASGVAVQWLFWIVQVAGFSSVLVGARFVGFIAGCAVAILGMIPALFIKEDPTAHKVVERVPLLKSWGLTMRDRNFLVLALAAVFVFASVLLVDTLGFYLLVYYVFEGDLAEASVYKGIGGTMFHVIGIAFIPILTSLSKRWGKRRAFEICVASIILGGISKLFFYMPGMGWMVVLPNVFLAPGLVAVLVLVPSMLGDVAAQDERKSGNSRQGMFAASMNWTIKLSSSGVALVSGFILLAAGWVHGLEVNQAPMTFEKMRWTFALGTMALAATAALLLRFYKVEED